MSGVICESKLISIIVFIDFSCQDTDFFLSHIYISKADILRNTEECEKIERNSRTEYLLRPT